jgi:hypothetical protein
MFEKIKNWFGTMKGQVGISQLVPLVVALVTVGLVAAFSLQIMGSIRTGMTANSSEANATGLAVTGISNLTSQFGNLGTIAGAVVVIGLLVAGFAYFGGRGR